MKNKKLITRDIIGENYRIISHLCNDVYDKKQIVEYIDKWHYVFEQNNLQPGDSVTYISAFDGKYLAFFIAACEYGLIFSAYYYKDAFLYGDYYKRGLELKFLVYNSHLVEEKPQWEEVNNYDLQDFLKLELPDNYVPKFDKNNIDENAVVYMSMTSGTTGKPSVVKHTHKTILTASYKAINLFYNLVKADKIVTLSTMHIHHAGVMTITFMPAIILGADFHFSVEIYDVIEKVRPNIATLFEVNSLTLKEQNKQKYDTIDLSFIQVAITGGSYVMFKFLDFLLNRGVGRIFDVYGATQALVPILYSEYTLKDAREGYKSKTWYNKLLECHMGSLFDKVAPGWEYYIDPDTTELMLRGDSLCVGQIKLNEKGFYHTTDSFAMAGNQIGYMGRYAAPIKNSKGNIIPSQEVLQHLTNGYVVPKHHAAFFVSEKDNKAYLHVKIYDTDIEMHYFDLSFINAGLQKKFGSTCEFDEVIINIKQLTESVIKF